MSIEEPEESATVVLFLYSYTIAKVLSSILTCSSDILGLVYMGIRGDGNKQTVSISSVAIPILYALQIPKP